MSNTPELQLSSPPDLLRRFVPLPYEVCIRSANSHLHFRTNEPRLATALGTTATECGSDIAKIKCTILCDSELSAELSEGIVLETSDAVFLNFGRECLIAVDRETQEVTGFVAAELLEGAWSATIVPALMAVMAGIQ